MRTVGEIEKEIKRVETAQRKATRKTSRCAERLAELRLELSEAEKTK